ncbi:MAG: polyprenyl synthetase family protein [Planctomycetota bacterium]|jgi:geranylgeranyl diphosphate synthase type II|nr:polyprenyl synthetase family protein [Planctomycetota bacterium]
MQFLQGLGPEIEGRLTKLLPFADQRPESLHEAMRYSVLGGGKRLRPALTLASFLAAGGGSRTAVVDAACAIEFLHAYTLVHDDLPAMDNDAMRRNRLTCHKAFGEGLAILVGDALQALAFETLAAASGDKADRTVVELAKAAGSLGTVGGQALDLEWEGKNQDPEIIERIDRWKTGSLIACCCRMGCIFAGGDGEKYAKLNEYGEAAGVMYQICDDLLDHAETEQDVAKPRGADKEREKQTYPAAIGVEAARELAVKKSAEAKRAIKDFGREALYLRLLADYLLERKN